MFGKNKVDTDPQKIEKLLTKNVEEIFIKEELKKKLLSGKRLKIKLGFDPTSPNIHIGRAVVLRKLREFQDLGHEIIFLVGNFTARIGDPSDKLNKRPMLGQKEINEYLKTYKKQLSKILDLKKAKFVFNNDWLSKLTFEKVAELAETFTVQQMLSRRNFKDRFEKGDEISVREFLYPLMQGYDSVVLNADVEIGGFDQLFNLKAGRIIQKHYGMPEQDIMTCVMLEGTDGRKMSSSWGNVISLLDSSDQMFGKIMALRDDLIVKYLQVCTDLEDSKISDLDQKMKSGELNPKEAKIILAKEIVKIYHSEDLASSAEQNFRKTFEKGEVPENVLEISCDENKKMVDLLIENKVVDSKTDWRRLIDAGAISNIENKQKISDPNFVVSETSCWRIGKKRFVKFIKN